MTNSAMTEGNERVAIKSWNAVALWDWGDGESTNCAICRNLIMEPCIECQSGQSHADGGQCTVSWGQCSHGFHTHCIKKWLSARSVCPLDNVEWVYKKKGD